MHRVLIFAALFLPLATYLYVLIKYNVGKPTKLALSIGGFHGALMYALFVYSEWRGSVGVVESFTLVVSAIVIGLIFGLVYFLIGFLINKIRLRSK